jgi:hypothetical protein
MSETPPPLPLHVLMGRLLGSWMTLLFLYGIRFQVGQNVVKQGTVVMTMIKFMGQ